MLYYLSGDSDVIVEKLKWFAWGLDVGLVTDRTSINSVFYVLCLIA